MYICFHLVPNSSGPLLARLPLNDCSLAQGANATRYLREYNTDC